MKWPLAAAAHPAAVGQTINVGSGREISIGDLAALVGSLVGREVVIQQDEQRVRPKQSEVERLLADTTRARELLGWQPRVPLEEGLSITIAWVREHLHLYRPDTYAV